MRNMIVSGMNVARFNFSPTAPHEEHAARLAAARTARRAVYACGRPAGYQKALRSA